MRTITAIATASGVGSIAIVRVSGQKALDISSKLINSKKELSPRVANLHSIYNKDGALIDRAIVVYFKAPNSFTGEDIVEFQCHGGVVIAQEILPIPYCTLELNLPSRRVYKKSILKLGR